MREKNEELVKKVKDLEQELQDVRDENGWLRGLVEQQASLVLPVSCTVSPTMNTSHTIPPSQNKSQKRTAEQAGL